MPFCKYCALNVFAKFRWYISAKTLWRKLMTCLPKTVGATLQVLLCMFIMERSIHLVAQIEKGCCVQICNLDCIKLFHGYLTADCSAVKSEQSTSYNSGSQLCGSIHKTTTKVAQNSNIIFKHVYTKPLLHRHMTKCN